MEAYFTFYPLLTESKFAFMLYAPTPGIFYLLALSNLFDFVAILPPFKVTTFDL